ncbi:MAG: hypothetical protein D6760_00300, partial [Deltaproteobacteria bacterium]
MRLEGRAAELRRRSSCARLPDESSKQNERSRAGMRLSGQAAERWGQSPLCAGFPVGSRQLRCWLPLQAGLSRTHGCIWAVALVVVLVSPLPVWAHHILGIPHYAYDEDYPQAPVLTYRMQAGPYEVKMTGYPGMPVPGEPSSLHVYIKRSDNGRPFDGGVRLTVTEDRMIGSDPIVYGPIDASLDERIYKFYPRFDKEANYTAQIEFEADGVP